jgi:hypothetical protein
LVSQIDSLTLKLEQACEKLEAGGLTDEQASSCIEHVAKLAVELETELKRSAQAGPQDAEEGS